MDLSAPTYHLRVAMRLRLARISPSIVAVARLRPGCAFLFVCLTASAQNIPQGYVATREGDVVVMRPSEAVDPDVAIRVYPPMADDDDPATVAHRWALSHPIAGVNPTDVGLQDKDVNGVSALFRDWKDGAQQRLELIMLPQAGPGRYRPVVARMPSQPGPLLSTHSQATKRVVTLILAGQFQQKIPPHGKGSPTRHLRAGGALTSSTPAAGGAASSGSSGAGR